MYGLVKHALLNFFFFCILHHQVLAQYIPAKEELCGVIVDGDLQTECLNCFTQAGSISVNPEAVRACVATYLPPVMAVCAVPQARRNLGRIEQIHPLVHPNNTNANLLPNCLKRRLRDLNRYLQRENVFTVQAGDIVKTVVSSKIIRNGGANMLGVFSQKAILEIPLVSALASQYAQSCLDDYANSRALPKSNIDPFAADSEEESEEDDDDDTNVNNEVDLKELLTSENEDDWENDDDTEENDDEGLEERGKPPNSGNGNGKPPNKGNGNGLPYGGTNALAKEMILGECIVNKLIETDAAIYLIQAINSEDFYNPIPFWWVRPLLYWYKGYREQLEG